MTPEQQRIADRIVKLLAVAGSTTFAAEAETARRLAGDLMKTHAIDAGEGKPEGSAFAVRTYVPFAKGMRWEGMIVGALDDLTSCAMLYNDDLDRYWLIGANFDLDVFEYMLHAVNGQRIAAWTGYKAAGGADSFNKFCYGFAVALKDRISGLIDPQKAFARHDLLVDWYKQNIAPVEQGEPLAMGRSSSVAGMDAGRSASLHRGTLTSGSQKLLGRR